MVIFSFLCVCAKSVFGNLLPHNTRREMSTKSTPDYFHCIEDKRFRNNVYEPEADTFVFLDGLDKERDYLLGLRSAHSGNLRCVEIGCGSGTVITHLQRVAGYSPGDEFHAVDINPIALEATSLTWTKSTGGGAEPTSSTPADPTLHLHLGDLFSPFSAGTIFDVICFNPPYVPTTAEELEKAVDGNDVITAAWCGGPRGRVVVDRFMSQLPQMLSVGGVCYIIAIKENDVDDMKKTVVGHFGSEGRVCDVDTVIRRFTGEDLSLLKVERTK